MKIKLYIVNEKNQKIQIIINDPNDPLMLYILDLTDLEFHQIKTDQNLLMDFQQFPDFFLKMV